MPEYRLTRAAAQDMLSIAIFGIGRFGPERAKTYYSNLVQRFGAIAKNPEFYPQVTHIRAGYRRSVCGVHSIYYRVEGKVVEIVRVLGHQDVNRAL